MRFKNPPIIPWSPGHYQQSLSLRRTRLSKGFRGEYDPWRPLLASTRNAYYPGKSPRVAPRGGYHPMVSTGGVVERFPGAYNRLLLVVGHFLTSSSIPPAPGRRIRLYLLFRFSPLPAT